MNAFPRAAMLITPIECYPRCALGSAATWRNNKPKQRRRLLKYWDESRCCGFWCWPRREAQGRYPQASRPSEQRGPAPKSTQPREGAKQKGRLAASLARYSPLRGFVSLAPCYPALLLLRAAHPSISTVF